MTPKMFFYLVIKNITTKFAKAKRGTKKRNLVFEVLWLKTNIPNIAPKAPNIADDHKRVTSLMRLLPFLAKSLSDP